MREQAGIRSSSPARARKTWSPAVRGASALEDSATSEWPKETSYRQIEPTAAAAIKTIASRLATVNRRRASLWRLGVSGGGALRARREEFGIEILHRPVGPAAEGPSGSAQATIARCGSTWFSQEALVVDAIEGLDDLWVGLAAAEPVALGDGLLHPTRRPCRGALMGEGVEDSRDSGDPRLIGISSPRSPSRAAAISSWGGNRARGPLSRLPGPA